LKLLCGYGACDEISGRRHRDLFYLWHRDGPLADGREPCIFTGILFRRIGCAFASGHVSSRWRLGWFSASLPASVAQQPAAKNYVLNVLNSGELDLHAPLRWHGILRDEPATLPSRTSYEIELASVAYQERSVSIQGGLRASYTPQDEQLAAPELHAGGQVAIVTQARLPQLFRNEGAFDRRAFLSAQGIDRIAPLAGVARTNRASQTFAAHRACSTQATRDSLQPASRRARTSDCTSCHAFGRSQFSGSL
jgi:hypothetical protein